MMTLVIYDSAYGNTEQIAKAIASGIAGAVKVLRTGEVSQDILKSANLLIIGSPTYGGRPTPAMKDFLKQLALTAARDKDIATFDTRDTTKWVGILGYAAGKIARSL